MPAGAAEGPSRALATVGVNAGVAIVWRTSDRPHDDPMVRLRPATASQAYLIGTLYMAPRLL
jgi:hypothetical protein